MRLSCCGSSMKTCDSHVVPPSRLSTYPPIRIQNIAAISGPSLKRDSGRDHSSTVVPNNNNHSRELINDVVGGGISGILYKWVNYGKGWRPRWFALQDGVLSYYKIHGPDKIIVNYETRRGSRVIGDESMRWILRPQRNHHGNRYSPAKRWKPVGEVHLKVSCIQLSQSDDKKFSVFTGTKWLRLRAESREDRTAWIESFQTVKAMFPRVSNTELMAPVDNLTLSTEKLRQILLEEGLTKAAIWDCEQIMKNEFASLQKKLVLLKQKHWLLMDTLRQLEVHSKIRGKSLTSCNPTSVSSKNCAC